MAKHTQQNIEQVKVAINALLENHQQVSVKAISELTGISKFIIYTYPAARQYVRYHNKHSPRFLPKIENNPVAPADQVDEELEKILKLDEDDNPFNDPRQQEQVKPAKEIKEKPKAQSYEQYFQMPLNNGKYFHMSFPSDIDDEDKQDIADYLGIVLKRKLKV